MEGIVRHGVAALVVAPLVVTSALLGSGCQGGSSTGSAGSGGAGTGGTAGSGPDAGEAGDVGRVASCDEYVMPADCAIPDGAVLPAELRCTGLYANWPSRDLRCGVMAYAPAYQLWADGSGKQRYVWLPPGGTIDASNSDDFVYPVGTRFWKEFHVGPEGQQRLGETRYLVKVNAGWLYTAYVWSKDGTRATQTNTGVEDLFGSGHLVPTRNQCKTCHQGRPDFVLGWDFVMLGSGATGVTARSLADSGRLTGAPAKLLDAKIPGDAVERSALTYMHANCGISCHNQTANAEGRPSGLFLRLEMSELDSVLSTDAATSGINRLPSPNADYSDLAKPAGGDFYDFRPMDTERSLSLARMRYRGSLTAMPPIGTHDVDSAGVEALTAWIESMTPERSYPAAAP